jgi:hypothetical protein
MPTSKSSHVGEALFDPNIDILPPAQRLLWEELHPTPNTFVLYGGTAMALRLGHRQSDDFDFFSNESFLPGTLLQELKYLRNARVDHRSENTLTVLVDRRGPVKLSFFGDVQMKSVHAPDCTPGNDLQIASLLDLSATKLKTIQQRAEAKDYVDLAAALDAGVSLAQALGAASSIYGKTFNPMTTLKALTYFQDGNLPTLPSRIQKFLSKSVEQVDLEGLPILPARPGITMRDSG